MSRIRTATDLQTALDDELAWRVKELQNLKLSLKSSSGLGEPTLIRAGVAMLYAHWEGFIKNASLLYLKHVNDQRLKYDELEPCFVVFGAKRHLEHVSRSRKSELNIRAVEFFANHMGDRANLSLASAVNTESNLRSHVFENIACSLGIDSAPYSTKFNLVDTSLVDKRNSIAHGEYLAIGPEQYRSLVDEILQLMRQYKDDLMNAAAMKLYKK